MKDVNVKSFRNKMSNSYFFGSRPVQDWPKILIFFFFVLLIIAIWSYFFFLAVRSEIKNDFSNIQAPVVKDKEAEIQEVLEKYNQREVMFLE